MVLIIFSKMYKLRQKLVDVLMLHLKKENITGAALLEGL